MLQVQIHTCHQDAIIPEFQTKGAAGFDLAVCEDSVIQPNEIALLPTGLVMEVPDGYALFVASRSSTPRKFGLTMPHGFGVIDMDYCGKDDEIKIMVKNFTDKPMSIKKGQRIAQGLFVKIEQASFQLSDFSERESRGGFGSTGHA